MGIIKYIYLLIVIILFLPIIATLYILKIVVIFLGWLFKIVFKFLVKFNNLASEIVADSFECLEDEWNFKNFWNDMKGDWYNE